MIQTSVSPVTCVELIPTQRFMLVLDRSAGGLGSNIDLARLGVNFWSDYVDGNEELGLTTFSSTQDIDFPLSSVPLPKKDAKTWRNSLHAVVDNLKESGMQGNYTALSEALCAGLNAIQSTGRASNQVMILFAGALGNVDVDATANVVPDLIASGVRCYTIGLNNEQGSALLSGIASSTGAQYFSIDRNLTPAETAIAVSEVLIHIAGITRENSGIISFRDIDGALVNSKVTSNSEYAKPFLGLTLGRGHKKKLPRRVERFRFPVNITIGSSHCTLGVLWKRTNERFRIRVYGPDAKDIGRKQRIVGQRIRWVEPKEYPFAFCEIDYPKPGIWHVEVIGANIRGARFRTIGFEVNERISFQVWPAQTHIKPGSQIEIQARLLVPQAVPRACVTGWRRSPLGIWRRFRLSEPSNKRYEGIYRAHFPAETPGQYLVAVDAYCKARTILETRLNGYVAKNTKLRSKRPTRKISVPTIRRRILLTVIADPAGCSSTTLPCGQNSKLPWIPNDQQACLEQWQESRRDRKELESVAKQ